MTVSLRTRVAAAFAAALVLIALVGAWDYRHATVTIRDVAALREARAKLDTAHALDRRVRDAETGVRGYVIAGNAAFLAPRDSAMPLIPIIAQHLRSLNADDPPAWDILQNMDRLGRAHAVFDSQAIMLRRFRGAAAAAALVAAGQGKALSDSLSAQMAQLTDRINAELARRTSRLESSAQATRLFALLAGLLGLFAIAAAAWSVLHELAARERAEAKVKVLDGLLPICASCKKIRDDRGYWNQIESYVREHSEAEFSHGLCPDCAAKLYPEYAAKV